MQTLSDHFTPDKLEQLDSLPHHEYFLLLEFDHAHDEFDEESLSVEHEHLEDAHGLCRGEVVHKQSDEERGEGSGDADVDGLRQVLQNLRGLLFKFGFDVV